MDLLEILGQVWAQRALMASVMVGVMCGILGCFIVLRNMALIGDALSHAILPGIVISFIFVGYSTLGFFVGSVLAGLSTAIAITWIQQKIKTKNDAAIGIVFTAMFSIGVIGISWISKEQGVHLDLKDFLFGNVLGVSNQDLYLTLGITLYVIVSVIVFYRYLFISTFQPTIAQTMGISTKLIHYFIMLLLSFAVVASLRTVGVILVVAMLITPASTALLLSDQLKKVIVIAAVVGFFSACIGLLLAIIFATTPGPAMAIVATVFYLLAAFLSPKKGLLFRWVRKRKLRDRIRMEDILKEVLKVGKIGSISVHKIQHKLQIRRGKLRSYLKQLSQKELIQQTGEALTLTDEGRNRANRLIRAHRLWETFLVDQVGLNDQQIHAEAEKYEHLLTEEILDEVDEKLGYPTKDPHGSPIPSKREGLHQSLWQLMVGQEARIAKAQPNQLIAADLWNLGLLPETEIRIASKSANEVFLEAGNNQLRVAKNLADQINTSN